MRNVLGRTVYTILTLGVNAPFEKQEECLLFLQSGVIISLIDKFDSRASAQQFNALYMLNLELTKYYVVFTDPWGLCRKRILGIFASKQLSVYGGAGNVS